MKELVNVRLNVMLNVDKDVLKGDKQKAIQNAFDIGEAYLCNANHFIADRGDEVGVLRESKEDIDFNMTQMRLLPITVVENRIEELKKQYDEKYALVHSPNAQRDNPDQLVNQGIELGKIIAKLEENIKLKNYINQCNFN
ncbi:hypothetical protein [Bacillus toyonensis]|uniref:hypothetical protein n=1 Tax=Bacillus toyonensis TaxID=155322 RepID=UPI002E21344D|nr:hypothetical protein [Bacillus toyonensis]